MFSMKSGTSDQSTMVTWPRWNGRRPGSRRATSASTQSRERLRLIATSKMVSGWLEFGRVTVRSKRSSTTSISRSRTRNRTVFTTPEMIT